MNESKNRIVKIIKIESGYYWIIDAITGEWIDGDKRKYVCLDMCKRWKYKLIK